MAQITVPKNVRASDGLDEIDRVLLDRLTRDARIPNNALAAAAGIAPSTCLGRVRALTDRGVIRGYHADIDPAAIGRGLEAMIAVRVETSARGRLRELADELAGLDGVLDVYFIAGADDFLVHVATVDSGGLRDFVLTHLNARPAIASTETILVFEHIRPRGRAVHRLDR